MKPLMKLTILIISIFLLSYTKNRRIKTNKIKSKSHQLKFFRVKSTTRKLDILTADETKFPDQFGFEIGDNKYLVVDANNKALQTKLEAKHGGFGSTYRVLDQQTNEIKRIKVMNGNNLYRKLPPIQIKAILARKKLIIKELIKILKENPAKLIMKIFDYFEFINITKKQLYGVTIEEIEGKELDNFIKEDLLALSYSDVECLIGSIILGGVELYVRGIIHFDIKSDNLMITSKNSELSKCAYSVKVIDMDDKFTFENAIADLNTKKVTLGAKFKVNKNYFPETQIDCLHHYFYLPFTRDMQAFKCYILSILNSFVNQKASPLGFTKDTDSILIKNIEDGFNSNKDKITDIKKAYEFAKVIDENLDYSKIYSIKEGAKNINSKLDNFLKNISEEIFNSLKNIDDENVKKQQLAFQELDPEFNKTCVSMKPPAGMSCSSSTTTEPEKKTVESN